MMNRTIRTVLATVFTVGLATQATWAAGGPTDCNFNGVVDATDIADGTSEDCNVNGVPDDCDVPARGMDACADALPVCPGITYPSRLAEATSDGSSTCAGDDDIWYRYVPVADGTVTVDVCGPFFAASPSIHAGCPGTMDNELACSRLVRTEDCIPDRLGNEGVFQLTLDVTAGTEYAIRVGTGCPGCSPFSSLLSLTGPDCMIGTVPTSNDCNRNFVPDECEDCNGNGLADSCDVADGSSADCNFNGVPDECDIGGGSSDDCNANFVPDECEDCNGNGVADSCDIEAGADDCNVNGLPDECEVSRTPEAALFNLNANNAGISDLNRDQFEFTGGIASDDDFREVNNNIDDGGGDMYDGGNFLNTDLAADFLYTDGVVLLSDAVFGPGSRYFTNKYTGLFVLVADDISIESF